jgi:hypothetical protein
MSHQWRLASSARSQPPAPYFLKVYGLNGPEVRGQALKCPRLDIQHGELEIPPGLFYRIRTI